MSQCRVCVFVNVLFPVLLWKSCVWLLPAVLTSCLIPSLSLCVMKPFVFLCLRPCVSMSHAPGMSRCTFLSVAALSVFCLSQVLALGSTPQSDGFCSLGAWSYLMKMKVMTSVISETVVSISTNKAWMEGCMLCMNPLDFLHFTLVMVSPVICRWTKLDASIFLCVIYLLVLWIQLSDAELRALKRSVSILRKPLNSGFDVSLSQYDLAACPGRTPCFVLWQLGWASAEVRPRSLVITRGQC